MPMPLSILDVVDAIKQQVANRALGTEPQPAQPNLTPEPPPDVDYTQGMTRPDLTELGSKMEFKATPSRASAMLVALGNILQDRRNVEAAKQAASQGEYNAKLESAMDLNKARKGLQMKREFDEADPDVLLGRQAKQAELDMLPLKKEAMMADLLFKTKRADQYGQGRSGSGVGGSVEPNFANLTDEEVAAMTKWDAVKMKVWKAASSKEKLRMLKPHMNEEATAKLYSGGGYWDLSGGKPIYVKGEKEQSTKDLELARKINRQRKSEYDLMEPEEFTPEQAADYERLKDDAKVIEEAIYNKAMQSVKGGGTKSGTAPQTKKSIKDRAAELQAQGKSRKETEAILEQEGY